jgi:hypothetical protein
MLGLEESFREGRSVLLELEEADGRGASAIEAMGSWSLDNRYTVSDDAGEEVQSNCPAE